MKLQVHYSNPRFFAATHEHYCCFIVQRAGLVKLKKVLRAVHKQFSCPPPEVLSEKSVDLYLEDPDFDEDKLREMIKSATSAEQVVNYALHSRRKEGSAILKAGGSVKIESDSPAASKPSSALSSCKIPDRCLPGAGAEAENGLYSIVYENLYYLVAQVLYLPPLCSFSEHPNCPAGASYSHSSLCFGL